MSYKYKDKNGTELCYTGKDSHTLLVKEVVREAIRMLSTYDSSSMISIGMAIGNTKKFLEENFNITNDDES